MSPVDVQKARAEIGELANEMPGHPIDTLLLILILNELKAIRKALEK